MTPAEQKRLVDLLGKLLNLSHKRDQPGTFKLAWKLLYALGAHVIDQDTEFWVVTSK